MLTYGFYNSIDHDRRYDAIQMSSIFDGIVRDGVFMSIGNRFQVKQDSGMTILVDSGRAWFNHTWTLNDAQLPIQIPQSEVVLNRIDAVVLEINHTTPVRANSIKVVKGTPASNPARPALTKSEYVNQYPFAYIRVNQRVTEIRQADITNMIGTSECPFVTGILETMDIDMLVTQWEDQWQQFYEAETKDMSDTNAYWKRMWESWYQTQVNWWSQFQKDYVADMNQTGSYWKDRWESWFYKYVNINSNDIDSWKHENEDAFTDWFNNLQTVLDENVATTLTNAVTQLQNEVKKLQDFKKEVSVDGHVYTYLEGDRPVLTPITDEIGNEITDENLEAVDGVIYEQEPVEASDYTPIEIRRDLVFGVSDLSWRRYRA